MSLDPTFQQAAFDALVPSAISNMSTRNVVGGITASTTQEQGQGALTASINYVSVCANADDTVTLPSAATGREIIVINGGDENLQIFPAADDDLGLGANTPTTLVPGRANYYVAVDATNWVALLDLDLNGISAAAATVLDDATVAAMVDTLGGASSTGTGGLVRASDPTVAGMLRSVAAGLTASVTQTQGDALALTADINQIATCANANDAVRLPTAAAGKEVIVINSGAETLGVFPATDDDAGGGANTAVTQATGVAVRYIAYDATTWARFSNA